MLSVEWKPDKTLTVPLYKQIKEYIKQRISCGDWTVGTRLPAQRDMAEIFEVNRSTVVEALEELKADGLVEGHSSGGTVVINNTWSLIASVPPPNWQKYINSGIHKPNLPIIQQINRAEFEKDIIRLGTGELAPSLFPCDAFSKVMERAGKSIRSLSYEEPKGAHYLRETVCSYVKKFGINTSPSSVLIVSGCLQALQLVSMSILTPGSTVLVEKPSYLKSLHVFQSSGLKLKGIRMDDQGIRIKEMISSKARDTTLLYTIPTFQNPTGTVMSEQRRGEVLSTCEEERVPIIEDDAYRELWLDAEPPKPIKSMDKNGIVLYTGTLSKTFAAGMRIGWLIGPEPVIERLGDIKMQTDYGSSSLSQYVTSEIISSGLYERYIDDLREKLRQRREYTLKLLDRYFTDAAYWRKPSGGFYVWLRLNRQVNTEKLFYEAYKNGILINPGSIYDFEKNQYLRLSYSYASDEELDIGLLKLRKIIGRL